MGKFRSPRVVPRERVRSPKFESRRGKLLRDGCACAARVKLGMRNVRRVNLTDIWSWYRVELRVGDHLGRSEELVSRCVECDLAEPESMASLGGSAPGVVDGIRSIMFGIVIWCMTEFRQPLQVQSHLEMSGILVQLGHTRRT